MLNNSRYLSIIGLLTTMLLILPCISQAGGLYINEFGTPSMGTAGAGTNAVASDASTSFHNPAGMTRIKGKELMGTGGLLYSTIKFDPDSDTPAVPHRFWEAFMSIVSTTAGSLGPVSHRLVEPCSIMTMTGPAAI